MSNATTLSSIRYKWATACTSNTCIDSNANTVLNWRGITVAELITGPKGIIFTPLYRFNGAVDLSIKKFPEASKDFDQLIADIHTLEKICNMYEEVVPRPQRNDVLLKARGQEYASILFHGGEVTYTAKVDGGQKTTQNPATLIKYSEYIRTSSRKVDMMDDAEIINSLGKNLKLNTDRPRFNNSVFDMIMPSTKI